MFSIGKASRSIFLALTLLLLLSVTLSAQAQEPTVPVSDDDVNEVAKQLYCPICESTPLDVCATQACADWREVIRTKLAEGQTAEDIKAYFELQYGPQALAEPPRSGFTLAVWILPVLAFVVAAFFFVQYLRSLRTSTSQPDVSDAETANADAPEEPPAQDDYRAPIESELREK
ncbi:MAG: cytochrome c-type biogenesis protein CcmH [Chloroflexota bacterium]|jgi:cytochrome c-type biogenesis protein CcmH